MERFTLSIKSQLEDFENLCVKDHKIKKKSDLLNKIHPDNI